MKTVWSIFRDYVNSKPVGTEITRQEILKEIEKHFISRDDQCVGKPLSALPRFSPVTFDCARNMSEKVGYLAKTNTLGRYIIVEHFATDYTVSQLRKDYDNGNRCNYNK